MSGPGYESSWLPDKVNLRGDIADVIDRVERAGREMKGTDNRALDDAVALVAEIRRLRDANGHLLALIREALVSEWSPESWVDRCASALDRITN